MTSADAIPEDIYKALYPSVGSLVIYWALLEQSLEHWVALLYHRPGGNAGYKKIPFLLTPKIGFLRARLADLAELKSVSQEGLDLLEKVERVAEIRDILVHGAISGYQPDTGQLKFVRLGIDKADNMHEIKPEYVTIQEILEAGNVILDLNTACLHFGRRLIEGLPAR